MVHFHDRIPFIFAHTHTHTQRQTDNTHTLTFHVNTFIREYQKQSYLESCLNHPNNTFSEGFFQLWLYIQYVIITQLFNFNIRLIYYSLYLYWWVRNTLSNFYQFNQDVINIIQHISSLTECNLNNFFWHI